MTTKQHPTTHQRADLEASLALAQAAEDAALAHVACVAEGGGAVEELDGEVLPQNDEPGSIHNLHRNPLAP